jgi:hypothetical protein
MIIPLEEISVWDEADIRHRIQLRVKAEVQYAGKWAGYVWKISWPGDCRSEQNDTFAQAADHLAPNYRSVIRDLYEELEEAWEKHVEEMTLLNNQQVPSA